MLRTLRTFGGSTLRCHPSLWGEPASGKIIRRGPVDNAMSKGAETARLLKSRLPHHADALEAIAENFDGLERNFAEIDRALERLNSRLR